jgi:uncharacterized protein (DUF1778 family)
MKTGRPRLSTNELKAQITGVRLRTDERELFERAASEQNQNLSEWIRDTLLRRAKRQPRSLA